MAGHVLLPGVRPERQSTPDRFLNVRQRRPVQVVRVPAPGVGGAMLVTSSQQPARCLAGIVRLLAGFAWSADAADGPATWPQWRGPTRDGQVSGPAWPTTLQGDALKLLWRVELGPGYSGPVV